MLLAQREQEFALSRSLRHHAAEHVHRLAQQARTRVVSSAVAALVKVTTRMFPMPPTRHEPSLLPVEQQPQHELGDGEGLPRARARFHERDARLQRRGGRIEWRGLHASSARRHRAASFAPAAQRVAAPERQKSALHCSNCAAASRERVAATPAERRVGVVQVAGQRSRRSRCSPTRRAPSPAPAYRSCAVAALDGDQRST